MVFLLHVLSKFDGKGILFFYAAFVIPIIFQIVPSQEAAFLIIALL